MDKIKMSSLGFVTISAGGYTGISEIYAATYISKGISSIYEHLNYYFEGKTIKQTISVIDNLNIPFVSRNGLFKASLGSLENAFLDLCAKMKKVPLFYL